MGHIYSSISELAGHTPLLELTNYEKEHHLKAKLLAKLEYFEPTGSVKDRAALRMIQEAEREGKLHPGDTILDNTSGNTGIAEAQYAFSHGYNFEVFLEPGVSKEREDIFKAFGVKLHWFPEISPRVAAALSEGKLNVGLIMEDMQKYADDHGYFYINQCGNENNTLAHYYTTGPEIYEDTEGQVDAVVLLAGTAGTLTGLSKYFAEKKPDVQLIAVQPAPQSRLTPENKDPDSIDGVVAFQGAPEELQPPLFVEFGANISEWQDVAGTEAYAVGQDVLHSDGLFLGESAAAALAAATRVAERPEFEGKNIVVIMADNGLKYLSTKMYQR